MNGRTLTVTFNEDLDLNSRPAVSTFSSQEGARERGVSVTARMGPWRTGAGCLSQPALWRDELPTLGEAYAGEAGVFDTADWLGAFGARRTPRCVETTRAVELLGVAPSWGAGDEGSGSGGIPAPARGLSGRRRRRVRGRGARQQSETLAREVVVERQRLGESVAPHEFEARAVDQ